MATSYSVVYDSFMQQIDDYKLIALFVSDPVDFATFLQGWLLPSIVEFQDICDQDLTDRNDTTGEFNFDLSEENTIVLSRLMVGQWLEKEVQDVTQMNLSVTDREFKRYAESKNLDSKTSYLIATRENNSQMLTTYAYKQDGWIDDWVNGTFF